MSPLESRGHHTQLQPTALFRAAFYFVALGQSFSQRGLWVHPCQAKEGLLPPIAPLRNVTRAAETTARASYPTLHVQPHDAVFVKQMNMVCPELPKMLYPSSKVVTPNH